MIPLLPRPLGRSARRAAGWAVLGAMGALAGRPTPGAAQAPVSPGRVTCESIGRERRECPVPAGAEVRLVRQLGRSPCEPGRSWGREGTTLWVDRGCRAEFSVVLPGTGTLVACGSPSPGRRECPAAPDAEVVLFRQVGEAPCVRGRTWGYGDGKIWTDGGCQAEFEVSDRSRAGPDEPVRLLCESEGGRRAECAVPGPGRVVLVRQISRASCTRGRSWGVEDARIWVTAGCRGEFEVEAP